MWIMIFLPENWHHDSLTWFLFFHVWQLGFLDVVLSSFIVTRTGFCGDVGRGYRDLYCYFAVLQWCQSIAHRLLLLVHCRLVQTRKSSTRCNVQLFLARVHHYSRCGHRDFPQRCSFFSFICKIWHQASDSCLLHACLHVALQTPHLVTVAMASDSGALF